MELYIDRDALGRGLARVQGIIERRSTQPILSHVLLHARDGLLRVSATDNEVAYLGQIAANVTSAGEIAVDAANLFQVVRSLPEAVVHLRKAPGERLEVDSGRASFRLVGLAAEDYPLLPNFQAEASATLAVGDLRRVVEQVSTSIPADDLRWGLNGAHIEAVDHAAGKRLRLVATDGHRLSCAEAAFTGAVGDTSRQLVPRKALAVLRKLLEGDGEVHVDFGARALQVRLAEDWFWFRLIDGEFPDYKAVVPKQHRHTITARRSDFLATLRRVSILAPDRTRPVQFSASEDELEVKINNLDRGEVRETLPIDLVGEPLSVGFNPRYLQDVLQVLNGDRVVLETPSAMAASVLRDPDADDAFFVVMPMRLD